MLQGIAGEIETASLSSSNFILGPGLTYTLQPNTPPAPTFTNPSNYYNKLQLSLNQGGNSTDTTFAIQISTTGNFSSNVSYIQADGTLGPAPVFQTYAIWQPSSNPITIIGLTPGPLITPGWLLNGERSPRDRMARLPRGHNQSYFYF